MFMISVILEDPLTHRIFSDWLPSPPTLQMPFGGPQSFQIQAPSQLVPPPKASLGSPMDSVGRLGVPRSLDSLGGHGSHGFPGELF